MNKPEPWVDLLFRHLDGTLSPAEETRVAEVLRANPDARVLLRDVAEQAVVAADVEKTVSSRRDALELHRHWTGAQAPDGVGTQRPASRLGRSGWAAAAAMTVLFVGTVSVQAVTQPDRIWIATCGGALQWTGDGGVILRDLAPGQSFRGGTLETLKEDAWATLKFRDGSSVTITGQSMLPISELRAKELHVRRGTVWVGAKPQPAGRPMLIHSSTVDLQVVGTGLTVEAGPSSTRIRVYEGPVRVTRLVDGRSVEVPAGHQVVASATADTELRVDGRPGSVHAWRSDLHADLRHGIPGVEGRAQTAPLLWRTPKGSKLLHLVALSASHGWSAPVLLTPAAIFRIRGRIDTPSTVYFGLSTDNLSGEFSGEFQYAHTFQSTSESDKVFDLSLDLNRFLPQHESAKGMATRRVASRPAGLELVDWWCCTAEKDSGLMISDVELIPARPQLAALPERGSR